MIPIGILASQTAAHWSLKAHAAAASGDVIHVTTAGVDTTGANLIVLALSRLAGTTTTISDSKGNTWTALPTYSDGVGEVALYYCINPTVGVGHTFTSSPPGNPNNYPTLYAAAFSSGTLSPTVDQHNGGTVLSASTVQPGSITPAHAGELIVCGLEYFNGGLPSINSGFTITDRIDSVGGVNFGGGLAYLIQTSATAVNPTWSNSGFDNAAAAIVSFAP